MIDILEKYDQETPQAPRQYFQEGESSEEYGTLVRLVMRFSGGRIENERQANMVLLVMAVVIFIISFFIFINPVGNTRSVPPGIIYTPGQPPRLGGPTITPEL